MILHVGILLCSFYTMAVVGSDVNNHAFARTLSGALVTDNQEKNIIYSPVSIQSVLAMAYLGARAETADELRKSLQLGDGDTEVIAHKYGNYLKEAFEQNTDKGPQLKLANRIFVDEGLEIQPSTKSLLEQQFLASVEAVPFANSDVAVEKINTWVEESTNGQIRNLMPAGSTNTDTSVILVNAIYFKGKWAKPFSQQATSTMDFQQTTTRKYPVQMMFADERFKYAELPELDATVVDLPYEHSDMSMLIVVPNKVDGLAGVEQKFNNMDFFSTIDSKLAVEDVELFLPKFKIEFDVDLKPQLQKLGISKIFSTNADLSGLFVNSQPHKVSEIRHKAFLDVNEAGTEAVAATFLKIVPMMLNLGTKSLRVDRPFMFAIRNKNTIFYTGHVYNIA